MKARQSVLLDTAQKVQVFLDTNATVIGPNIGSARRNFDDAVDQLKAMAVTQTGGVIASRGATALQRALRSNLRNGHMNAITQVAKIALPNAPDIQQLAVTTQHLSSQALVAAAQAMADAAEKYTSIFTQNGLPDDFVAQLRSAADAVTQSGMGRSLTVSNTSAATQGMEAQESRVRMLLKLLNALVVPKLGTDATLLAKWKSARAIDHQRPIVPVPSIVTSPPTTTPAAGTTPPSAASTPPASTTPVSAAGASPANS